MVNEVEFRICIISFTPKSTILLDLNSILNPIVCVFYFLFGIIANLFNHASVERHLFHNILFRFCTFVSAWWWLNKTAEKSFRKVNKWSVMFKCCVCLDNKSILINKVFLCSQCRRIWESLLFIGDETLPFYWRKKNYTVSDWEQSVREYTYTAVWLLNRTIL
jgi:hypothetical protein